MTLVRVPYETVEDCGTVLELNIPEKNLLKVFKVEEPKGLENLEGELIEALDKPVEGKKFSELIGKGKKVVFITENQFRAAPAEKILSPLIKKAQEVGSKVSVVIACGKVPALSEEEIRQRVGVEVVNMGIPVYCNDVSKPENYTFIGSTSAGTPLWILSEIANADAVITISTTQATLWGYGGSGMVIPGVSGNETIEINHIMSLSPDCKPGNNECKMQQDKYEALQLARYDMGINVVVSNKNEVIFINAGDPVKSHKKAVEYYNNLYKFDVKKLEKADVVITGTTAPTNHIFFHTSWAIVNCVPMTKEGGTIIMTSPCPGYGAWPGFALMDLMSDFMPVTDLNNEKVLKSFYTHERELWAGCIWYPLYRTMLTRKVKVVTLEENIEGAKAAGIDAITSLQEAIDEAMKKYGDDCKIAVVPYGRYTVLSE